MSCNQLSINPNDPSYPDQCRTIDPFAEYNSNVANRITRMLSGNENVLMSTNSLQLSQDSTSPTTVAVVQTGTVFKDDVFIEVPAEHRVDFEDPDNYINFGAGFNEIGYYYVVLEYTYVKSRPAPEVHIKILKPSQRGGYPVDSLLLIGVVNCIGGAPPLIDSFHNFDPENTDNRREFVKSYVGAETNLPTHEQKRDQSRMAYDSETDKFWLGYRDSWQEFGTGGSVITVDTTGTNVGELCYVDASGASTPALADTLLTGADICVKEVGLAVDSSGKGLTSGIGTSVPIETAQIVTTGDLLYLSETEAGKVTPNKTSPYYQVVGRALTSGDSSNPIDIIFSPKLVIAESIEGSISGWTLDGGTGLYWHDIDISALEVENAVLSQYFETSSKLQIQPADVEIRNSGDVLRVWMSVNTLTVDYVVSAGGGSGSGGGGGTTDHSLLLNLGYGSSGHTGFAEGFPGGHDNTDHIGTYIEASGVTYGALLSNGDIGTGATQVSQGNHTHSGLIPSGTVMLFFQSSAPVGWTLKTTGFNNNSMIVLGTSFAQGGSEDARSFNPAISTNASASHSHTISTQAGHTHGYTGTTSANSGGGRDQGSGSNDCAPHPHTHTFSGTTTSGGSHNHGGATGNGGSHAHSVNYDTYNPWYNRVIAATKD